MACKKEHSTIQQKMQNLPFDQGGEGRHKCAACAYEQGFKDGYALKKQIDLGTLLSSLQDSQAKAQRHKSPYAAYALGYYDGVEDYYK